MVKKYDEKSCGIVLFTEDNGIRKYLILHYPGGHWDFPKGHIEKGENEHETTLRELREETGIKDVEFINGFRTQISYKYLKDGKPSNKEVIFFLGKTKNTEVSLSFEHKGFIWLDAKKALEKLTFDNAKNLLKGAEKFLS